MLSNGAATSSWQAVDNGAAARLLLVESVVAGIGAIDERSSKALVLCSIWVNTSHRGRRLWQRLLSNLLDEIEPLYLGLGSGLVTAFDCNEDLRHCLESIGWTHTRYRMRVSAVRRREARDAARAWSPRHRSGWPSDARRGAHSFHWRRSRCCTRSLAPRLRWCQVPWAILRCRRL